MLLFVLDHMHNESFRISTFVTVNKKEQFTLAPGNSPNFIRETAMLLLM